MKTEEKIHHVKLIRCYDRAIEIDGYDDNYTYGKNVQTIIGQSPKWEEVTTNELTLLRNDIRYIDSQNKSCYHVIIEDISETIPECITNIREAIRKEREKWEKVKNDLDRKVKERKKQAQNKKIEKAKKLLEEQGLL